MKATARERLGSLFNPADYPDALRSLFDVTWDFPNVEPPSYLQQLSPDLYRQESQRVAARFDEEVQLDEVAFIEEMSRLVSHLTERISGSDDGQPKVFRDSAIENIREFFQHFQLIIDPTGDVRCLYDETLSLAGFGRLTIARGSHVEPTADGRWTADLSPVSGPLLGPFATRSAALTAEREWLETNWLGHGENTD